VNRGRVDWRSDAGQFAGIEALPFGVLIFVIGSLLVTNAWAVIDAKLAVSSAAREGARTYVEAPPDVAVAEARATVAAQDALEGHGRDPDRADIGVANPAGSFTRCTRVTATVTYRLPAVTLPVIGGYGRGFSVTSHHSEIIDPWRDDLPGDGCG
jgi:hypothetical protein